MYKITVVAGDGTGPEVMAEAKKVLNKTADVFNIKFEFNDYLIGGIAYEKFGTPLPDVTVKAAKDSDAVMLGAVGDWKYDTLPPEVRPEKALPRIKDLRMRHFVRIRIGNINLYIRFSGVIRTNNRIAVFPILCFHLFRIIG